MSKFFVTVVGETKFMSPKVKMIKAKSNYIDNCHRKPISPELANGLAIYLTLTLIYSFA